MTFSLLVFLDLLQLYGVLGVVIIALGILVFKFADQLISALAQRAANMEFPLRKLSRKQRKESIFKINRLLTELMQKLQADRIAIFEYHNGGYNLTGLPFLHFSLAIQRNKLGVDELSKDFDNMLVSSVPDFINEIDTSDIYYVESIELLKSSFPRLYRELEDDGIQSAIFCNLEGVDDLVGFVMIAFKNQIPESRKKIQKELFRKALKITSYLDYKH